MRWITLATVTLLATAPAAAVGLHGEMSPANGHWTRGAPKPASTVDLDCELDLSARTMEWSSPYALYCLEVTDRAPIEVWTDQSGTEYDPVLYLFCEPFDPTDAGCRAIIFDDDGGPGSMAMFHASDGLSLEPGRAYWLMIAWFDSMDEGRYLIDVSDNVTLCTVAAEAASWGHLKCLYR
jgi:hypothetical protein